MNYIFVRSLHDLTEKLAYNYWERRGHPLNSPEIDWLGAEKTVATSLAYLVDNSSLCGLRLEPDEGLYRGRRTGSLSELDAADSNISTRSRPKLR